MLQASGAFLINERTENREVSSRLHVFQMKWIFIPSKHHSLFVLLVQTAECLKWAGQKVSSWLSAFLVFCDVHSDNFILLIVICAQLECPHRYETSLSTREVLARCQWRYEKPWLTHWCCLPQHEQELMSLRSWLWESGDRAKAEGHNVSLFFPKHQYNSLNLIWSLDSKRFSILLPGRNTDVGWFCKWDYVQP